MILSEEMVDAFVKVWRKETHQTVPTASRVVVDEQDLRETIRAVEELQTKLSRIRCLEFRLAEVAGLLAALDK